MPADNKVQSAFRAAEAGAEKPRLNILGLPMGRDNDTAGGQNKTGWIEVNGKLKPHP